MISSKFKLSSLAIAVAASTGAHAALYNVEIVNDTNNLGIGGPIAEVTQTDCFTEECSAPYAEPEVANLGQLGESGQFIDNEIDFQTDTRFRSVTDSNIRSHYENFCDYQYKYKTCDAWASRMFDGTDGSGGVNRIVNSFTWPGGFTEDNINTKSFTGNGRFSLVTSRTVDNGNLFSPLADTNEISATSIAADGTIIGNTASGYEVVSSSNYSRLFKSRGFFSGAAGSGVLDTYKQVTTGGATSDIVTRMGPTRAFDSFTYDSATYIVGSSAVSTYHVPDGCSISGDTPWLSQSCQNVEFNNKATLWKVSGTTVDSANYVADWAGGFNGTSDSQSVQSSVRGAAVASTGTYAGKPVLVGYDVYNYSSDPMPQATVYLPISDSNGNFVIDADKKWSPKVVAGTELRQSNDWLYSNSIANDINDKMIVIGSSKRGSFDYKVSKSDVPSQNGSRNNRVWVASAANGNPTATYLEDTVFFNGAGGEMRSINNQNLIVGKVHAESHREVDGKMRRERGFITPVPSSLGGSDSTVITRSWWLDDLTNGGTQSSNNNQFRVIDANDINDAGIISATSLYCPGGYKSTSHNSQCSTTEQIVAVKLTPINGATTDDISTRSYDQEPVTRQGAGLGWLLIAGLALFGIRRK
ncbi:DUF3466 family protein [Vibrio sp. SCSIO 43136]|uniref:DUF3466 family protein n=1 Tax=Vibrio sp. SCSIO 43136 TaxID=2819101 RepID=UPI00207653A0|nr:DUF3466 family protein [Vibrio sp. SCSIO 43136]USD66534.1 DUF3466 family protein [Vibrio sp. SCSIO 43136]